MNSKPHLCEFNPTVIPYQYDVIKDVRSFDYSKGNLEVLLSGSYGSAKSILMAHIAATHCLMNSRACVCLARRALPDLKRTIFKEIIDHISEDLEEGKDYWVNETSATIGFRNGSTIISASCADKKYTKVRSLKLSMVIIEELIELNDEDMQFFLELKARLRRIPGIKENALLAATNPDAPSHWAYGYFIAEKINTRHVYYSNTFDNPFLDKIYISQLEQDLDPKMARRYIHGEWIEIEQEVVYYQYNHEQNFKDDCYQIDNNYPIHLSWDFNIGEGKPLSVVLFQIINDVMHVFDEVVVEGMRTADSCEELAGKGVLDHRTNYIVNGDSTGRSRDTRNIRSDYDIIKNYLLNYENKHQQPIKFEIDVPLANPAIRRRHNLVNAYCNNGQRIRLFVYKSAPTADKGLRLTQLKKGGNYIEDDSKSFQHITTAIGYGLCSEVFRKQKKPQGTVVL